VFKSVEAVKQTPMKHMGLIPARLSSERLKNKPLQLVCGKPLCLHVADRLINTGIFDEIVVATDSEDVLGLFKGHQAKAVMTDKNHPSGTDRIYEVVKNQNMTEPELKDTAIFNIQGDEPLLYKEDLLALKKVMDEGAQMASLYEALESKDLENINKVKVLLNKSSEAIYFSRKSIPFSRVTIDDSKFGLDTKYIGKHIGLYAYKASVLKDLCEQPEGYFEAHEKLEQLRALEMGVKIKMCVTQNSYMGVDTPEDLKKINELLSLKKTH